MNTLIMSLAAICIVLLMACYMNPFLEKVRESHLPSWFVKYENHEKMMHDKQAAQE